jgi:hypothetical protein
VSDGDAAALDALRRLRQDALDAGRPLRPLVDGPDHELLAQQVASAIRALQGAAADLADLISSWQYLAGMCGLFDGLPEAARPDRDWRAQVEQALALIEEATA